MKSNSIYLIIILVSFFNLSKSFSQSLPSYLPQDGLVAWYPFNNNFNDESGNGYNGNLVDVVPYISDRNNNENSAIQGGGGYITTSNDFFTFSRTDSFTISVWFTVQENSCSGRLISTESNEGHLRITNSGGGQIVVQFGDYLSPSPVTTDQWHNLIYVYNNRDELVYIDGQLSISNYEQEMSENLVYNTPFTIGAKASPGYDKWCGNIDDVGVWNRSLSPQEVTQLFSENTHPTDITLSNSTIDENSIIGTEIGTFTSTDVDTGDTHTYTLVSGDGDTDNGSFTITGDKLLSGESFDFETKPSYSVRVQTDDGNGGTFSKLFTITVTDVNEDDDGDGVNDDVDNCPNTPTGVVVNSDGCSDVQLSVDDEILDNSLKLYPNPVTNLLTIESKNVTISKVEIYSILGEKIKEIHSDFKTIRTDNLPNGIYIIRIYSEKGMVMKKTIKM